MATVTELTPPPVFEGVYPFQVAGGAGTDYDHAASLLSHLERLIEAECRAADEKEPHRAHRDPQHKSDTALYTRSLRRALERLVNPPDVHRILKEAHADGVRIWFDQQYLNFHADAAAHEKWAEQIRDNCDAIAIALSDRVVTNGYKFSKLRLSDQTIRRAHYDDPDQPVVRRELPDCDELPFPL
jgi:hypothetical protein